MAATEYEAALDIDLVREARSGNEKAFSGLFDALYDRVRAFAFRMVLDSQLADDVAQETFIRVARQMAGLREDRTFVAWVFRIAANVARDHLRVMASQQRRVELVAKEPPAETRADGEEVSDRVQAALAQLPVSQREAVALVYFDELNHAEAARCLGCAESTVSWRIFLAKRTLKKILRP